MKKFDSNPFPPLGECRIWDESFIESACAKLPNLKWKNIKKLNKTLLENAPNCPGVYVFVRKSRLEKIFSINSNYPLIVYIGKASNLKKRLDDYIKDKKSLKRYRGSERKVRDNIRVMFNEYGDNISVYFSPCSPESLTQTEDILIQVFDPVFNTSQRLSKSDFDRYESQISAQIMPGVEAYNDNEGEATLKKADMNSEYMLCKPESAF